MTKFKIGKQYKTPSDRIRKCLYVDDVVVLFSPPSDGLGDYEAIRLATFSKTYLDGWSEYIAPVVTKKWGYMAERKPSAGFYDSQISDHNLELTFINGKLTEAKVI